MRLWTLIEIGAAVVVLTIMTFTGMLAYHIAVHPLDGIFSRLVPGPGSLKTGGLDVDVARMLESQEMPNIDPGEQAFQKAYELMALGKMAEAREKLTNIFHIFPYSSSASTARRIIGEMNLDEILSTELMDGKEVHTVQRGDSYLAIASKYGTTIDCMVHLNSMTELKGIQPGDQLIVMPLDFRLLIEPRRKAISVWQDGKFIREYPALSMVGVSSKTQHTTISSKIAQIGDLGVPSHSENYRAARKILQLASPSLQIRGWNPALEPEPISGVLLRPHDMEELALLTRVGNEVEIR